MNAELDAIGARPLGVGELNRLARTLLERGLPPLWVGGEISNFRRYDSGHCYFSLKDETAQVRCVLFRHRAVLLDWMPADGMQVEARAVPTLYEARGEFQLNVETLRRAGLGALYLAYERLKARLAAEGLFDAARKRPLPAHPRRVGIVTSPRAAALRDAVATLRRRMPGLGVIVYPAAVQGDGAAAQIVAALGHASARAEVDVLILCRGGGSIEDLWPFNDEAVARAIVACAVPVISGIGHETDYTIADFVADVRAPTPTAAAVLATADRAELAARAQALARALVAALRRQLEQRMQRVDLLARGLRHPAERLAARTEALNRLAARLRGAAARRLHEVRHALSLGTQRLAAARPDPTRAAERLAALGHRLRLAAERRAGRDAERLARLAASLAHLDPQAVLGRGYSVTRRADGTIVRASDQVDTGEALEVTLARGLLHARVESKS
jgi:exodeoxyribonuclease VII large subunit